MRVVETELNNENPKLGKRRSVTDGHFPEPLRGLLVLYLRSGQSIDSATGGLRRLGGSRASGMDKLHTKLWGFDCKKRYVRCGMAD